jgi:hypothetical protein
MSCGLQLHLQLPARETIRGSSPGRRFSIVGFRRSLRYICYERECSSSRAIVPTVPTLPFCGGYPDGNRNDN